MLDVHVVTTSNRHLYAGPLDLFFEWRHRIYVEEKNWMPARADRRELDQFDGEEATYLLGYRNGDFVAGSRLLPFSGPTLLCDVFPCLVGLRGVPARSDHAEWTRMFVVPGNRERRHRGVEAAMCSAVMEFCVDEGIFWLGGIQETYWLPRWADYGWHLDVLGLPQDVDGVSCVAALFRVDAAALSGVRRCAGIERSQIRREGPQRRFVGRIVETPEFPDPLRRPDVPAPRIVEGRQGARSLSAARSSEGKGSR